MYLFSRLTMLYLSYGGITMKDIFLTNYSVKGIKALESTIELSFYKKTIREPLETSRYNVKGIYGMNGSGKTGIVTSVGILKSLVVNDNYLKNPLIQKYLNENINKKSNELVIEAEFIADFSGIKYLFIYSIAVAKKDNGKYEIVYEKLSNKLAKSQSEEMTLLFEVENGKMKFIDSGDKELSELLKEKTQNLLSETSLVALFSMNILPRNKEKIKKQGRLFAGFCALFVFGMKLHIYLDKSDDHSDFFVENYFKDIIGEFKDTYYDVAAKYLLYNTNEQLMIVSPSKNEISNENYERFEKEVVKLKEFLKIFKRELTGIEIDKKPNGELWVCDLNMVYGNYKINSEFESTGIKKLIKLYAYLSEMTDGGIVFIDEFDSNLHDVYLCALLEYLMNYGQGQLCFTTHNVGPMDVLKQNKKSIDFLSVDKKIYPWVTNGNYSPSRLYRAGMIQGSPFNVDSIDFIGVLGTDEGDNN